MKPRTSCFDSMINYTLFQKLELGNCKFYHLIEFVGFKGLEICILFVPFSIIDMYTCTNSLGLELMISSSIPLHVVPKA